MIKRILLCSAIAFTGLCAQAQTVEDLKATKAEKEAMFAEKQAEIEALESEINGLDEQIKLKSGWLTGFAGLAGFSFGETSDWAASPNPNSTSTSLSLSANAFANRMEEKYFWNNKLIANKAWQQIDTDTDNEDGDSDLFDNGTVDLLNVSSLYGYKLTEKIAISALGELNTSIESFLEPGTADLGIGATWTPISNMTVVVHPFNYRVTWPADGDVSSQGALGAKARVDYSREFKLASQNMSWSSTLTSFLPYTDDKLLIAEGTPQEYEADLFEWTWLNTISFQLIDGLGVGVSFGLRNADFEVRDKTQNFYNIGLSYAL